MFSVVQQDLLTSNSEVIAHQVNCKGVMGAGLALQIRRVYPIVFTKYAKACNMMSDLLGKIQIVHTPKHVVANLFAQEAYGRDRRYTDYDALTSCLVKLRDYMRTNELTSLALPYGIGCGLAGGNWQVVESILNKVFTPDCGITVTVCKK